MSLPSSAQSSTVRPDAPALPRLDRVSRDRAQSHPQRPFLTFYDHGSGERTEFSVATFSNWVAKTANLLVDEFEIAQGERVATIIGSHWTQVVVAFACWRAGACVVPLDPDAADGDMDALRWLSRGEVSAAFVREDAGLAPVAAALDRTVAVGVGLGARMTTDPGDALGYAEEVTAFGDDFDGPEVDAGTAAVLAFRPPRPGDPGQPVAVPLTRRTVFSAAAAVGAWGVGPGDRLACLRPSTTVDGLVLAHLGAFFSGASVVLSRGGDAPAVWRLIAQERASLGLVGAGDVGPLAAAAPRGEDGPQPFRGVLCADGSAAGAHEPGGVPFPVYPGLGVMEAACGATFVPQDVDTATRRWVAGVGVPTVGCPAMAAEVAALDTAGMPQEPAVEGELAVRGPAIASGREWVPGGERGFVDHGPDGRAWVFLTSGA